MEKGQKCLALTMWKGKPLWIAGKLHDVLELKTHKSMVVAVRQDYQEKLDGHGVIVVPPEFCFASIWEAGQGLDALGKALDGFVANHIPDSETPPFVIDEHSDVFEAPKLILPPGSTMAFLDSVKDEVQALEKRTLHT